MLKRLTDRIAASVLDADRLAAALEALALAWLTRLAAWIACIPTVMLTARSIETVFAVSPQAGLASAIALEVVGQSVVNTYLKAREWNATKRKSDPRANAGLALGSTVVYFATDFVLIGVLEIPKAMTDPIHWAALLFPLAQVVSTVMTGERAAQFRREAETEVDRKRRRAMRKASRKRAEVGRKSEELEAELERKRAEAMRKSAAIEAETTRKAAEARRKLLAGLGTAEETYRVYRERPGVTQAEPAEITGYTPRTVRNHLAALAEAGVMKRNGNGWEAVG